MSFSISSVLVLPGERAPATDNNIIIVIIIIIIIIITIINSSLLKTVAGRVREIQVNKEK